MTLVVLIDRNEGGIGDVCIETHVCFVTSILFRFPVIKYDQRKSVVGRCERTNGNVKNVYDVSVRDVAESLNQSPLEGFCASLVQKFQSFKDVSERAAFGYIFNIVCA